MAVTTTSSGELQLSLIRGDSDDFLVTVTDDATPTPNPIDLSKAVDGTANRRAVVRFAVKTDPDAQTNAEATVFKASHYDDQLPFLAQSGATMGQCRVLVDKGDTEAADPSATYRWDIEVSRQDSLRTGASVGTFAVTAGSKTITGTGTAFTKAKVGDIFQPLGVLNTRPVIVDAVVSATQLTVDYDGWTTESGVAFEVRRGKHKTAARGPFVVESGVVAQ
jgi:hypothetical protein